MMRAVHRRLLGIVVAALLALSGLNQSDAIAAEEPNAKAEFRAAYGRYQHAIEHKDAEAAATAAKEALDLGPGILADDSPSMAALYVNYGMALVDAKQYKEALDPLHEAIRRLEVLNGKDHESLIDPLWALADAYEHSFKRPDKNIGYLRRILRIVEKNHGKDGFLYARINQSLGEAFYWSVERQRRARHYFEKAYNAYNDYYRQPAYMTGHSAFWLGKSAMQLHSYKKAEEHFLHALSIFEETSTPGHELPLLAHTFLIALFEERGKSEQADMHCQAISLLRPLVGVDGHKPLYKKMPIYPSSGGEGFVLVEFTVTTRGTVSNVSVVESEGGKAFERSALEGR